MENRHNRHDRNNFINFRCKKCGKLLFSFKLKGKLYLEYKCLKCKEINHIDIK